MPANPEERWQLPSTYFVDRENRNEMTRLAIQDQFITKGMGGVLPEQPDPSLFRRVLDVACGTGGWLIETAQTYPNMTKLIGVDVNTRLIEYAQAQAKAAQVDDRVEFVPMDALFMLDFPDNFFDLVNMRFAMSFVRTWEWPNLLKGMQRVTRSGGVIRLTDVERFTSSHPAPLRPFVRAGEAFFRAGHLFRLGQTTDTFTHGTFGVADDLSNLLDACRMRNVLTHHVTLDFLPGTPEAHSFAENLRLGNRASVPFVQKWGGLSDDYEQMYQEMLQALQQPDYVASWSLLTAWGSKP